MENETAPEKKPQEGRFKRLRPMLMSPWLAALLLAIAAMKISSETLTLTATYPSPMGIYNTIVTTGYNCGASCNNNTLLARNGGNVGIGTASPAYLLDVAGTASVARSVRFNPLPGQPASPATGETIFNSAASDIEYYNGSAWVPLGGGSATPGTWTCTVRQQYTTVTCLANEKVISGGCGGLGTTSGYPVNQGWTCQAGFIAYANCCL